jgi:hypothetical protein
LAEPSGSRSSIRPGAGTRIICVRLSPAKVTLLGDQLAPDVVGGALIRL